MSGILEASFLAPLLGFERKTDDVSAYISAYISKNIIVIMD